MLNQCGVVIETLTLLALQRRSLAHWVASRNVEVVSSTPINAPSCFFGQDTLPLLLSTGWFQEWFRE